MSLTKRDHFQAFEEGAAFRRSGGKLENMPSFYRKQDPKAWEERWRDGYESENKGKGRATR